MKGVVIVGSTGSIGKNALEVIRRSSDKIKVIGLCAGKNWELLLKQIEEFHPLYAAISDEEGLKKIRKTYCIPNTKIGLTKEILQQMIEAPQTHIVLCASIGEFALKSVMYTIENTKVLALASKEPIVMAGDIIMKKVKEKNIKLIPVDSEHNALYQLLYPYEKHQINKIILTASGGPFLNKTQEELKNISVKDALKHPTWNMGKKITIDSATLMNKALEIVEARWLFDINPSQIEVIIHPQSIVHGIVELTDRGMLSYMAWPDMKGPIQYALLYPERVQLIKPVELSKIGSLTFIEVDKKKFPSIEFGYEVCRDTTGTKGVVMNAANDVAVERFLKGEIRFTDIFRLVDYFMKKEDTTTKIFDLEERILLDKEIREKAKKWISSSY